MSDFKPTEAQKNAIGARNSAILISAGAGSGKTKVLTERLLAWLRDREHPADLDSFLIITFTRAAAAELRGRITEELGKALAREPENAHLRRQSALCRKAQIGTIDSFCTGLLRENSQRAGISPDFKILDEDRARLMQLSAVDRVLERRYEHLAELPEFRLLADTLGAGRDDVGLAELCLELHRQIQCHPRPRDWVERQLQDLRRVPEDAAGTVWGRELLEALADTAAFWADEMDAAIGEMGREPKIFSAYSESFGQTADALRDFCRCAGLGWDRARACLPIPFPKLKGLLKNPDKALSDRLQKRREACKKACGKLSEQMACDSARLLEDLLDTAPAMCALLELTVDFDEEYHKAKQRANLLDYGDVEHLAAELLTEADGRPTELAGELSQRYTEIMVDEYQDVSRVQDAIFRALSREGKNLFFVGDVKQSIYRFRLADPEIFNEKYRDFASYEEAKEPAPRKILLRENFRSRREIILGVNALFSRLMSRRLGDLDYDERAELRFGAEDYQGEVPGPELLLLDMDGREEENPRAAEAAMVAGKIRELMEAGTRVQGREGLRPLRYGDIALLMRTVNKVGSVYRRELSLRGIPVAAGQGGAYYSSVEVSTVMSMLAVLDDPHQDVPLIAVLRSPAFGFEADQLSAIRACDKDLDFYGALCLYARGNEKASDFLALLERLREEAPDLAAAQLIERLLDQLDLLAICSAMTDGEQRRRRLLALIDLAEGFEASGFRGLHRFVLWLRQKAEKGEEPSLGAASDSAVQILSVHKSKGLEFPVVFLCDAGHLFKLYDRKNNVLVHPELGLGSQRVDLKRRMKYPSLAYNAICQRLNRELKSEEMRLLYVALTRARERLFVTAAVKNPDRLVEAAREQGESGLNPELLQQKRSALEWLLPAVAADGEVHWRLRIESPEKETGEKEEQRVAERADPAALGELEENLSFVYPYESAEALPSKITATELKDRAEPDPDVRSLAPREPRPYRLPDLGRQERPLSAAERGTATHLVLQRIELSRTGSREEIREEIRRLAEAGYLSPREARGVEVENILRLFASPLGKRILAAPEVHREFRFSLLCPAKDYFPEGGEEQVLLQGVVDCYLVEDGEITVIDYKTDRVPDRKGAEERAVAYAGQLRAYARALERITGLPVRRTLLFFLSLGETVSLDGPDFSGFQG